MVREIRCDGCGKLISKPEDHVFAQYVHEGQAIGADLHRPCVGPFFALDNKDETEKERKPEKEVRVK